MAANTSRSTRVANTDVVCTARTAGIGSKAAALVTVTRRDTVVGSTDAESANSAFVAAEMAA